MIARHGIDARSAVMVGDRGVDMRAARHHDLAALGALWGYGSRDELLEHGAHALCEDPAAVADAVRSAALAPAR
jgi:phosphoglycolate phosphatase